MCVSDGYFTRLEIFDVSFLITYRFAIFYRDIFKSLENNLVVILSRSLYILIERIRRNNVRVLYRREVVISVSFITVPRSIATTE